MSQEPQGSIARLAQPVVVELVTLGQGSRGVGPVQGVVHHTGGGGFWAPPALR